MRRYSQGRDYLVKKNSVEFTNVQRVFSKRYVRMVTILVLFSFPWMLSPLKSLKNGQEKNTVEFLNEILTKIIELSEGRSPVLLKEDLMFSRVNDSLSEFLCISAKPKKS